MFREQLTLGNGTEICLDVRTRMHYEKYKLTRKEVKETGMLELNLSKNCMKSLGPEMGQGYLQIGFIK